jgi:hypothetical protein
VKLFEMKTLPKTFSKAKIDYDEGASAPRRNGDVIVFPHDGYTDLYPIGLQRQKQFILTRGPEAYWFGGTDENPFLVRINVNPVKAFLEGGVLREACFYQSLRLREIGQMEQATRRHYKRQGDIFAVPLNIGWADLERCFRVSSRPLGIQSTDGAHLFGTRHLLRGKVVDMGALKIFGVGTSLIALGTVVAPDHRDLVLGDKPHALYQTANLYEPERAD